MTRTRTMRMEGQEKTGAGAAAGGRLVAVDGRTLPLRGVGIRADAAGGLARVVLEQHFVNSYAEPLRVTYQVPLPPEGALAGYTVRVGDRRLVGEVERLTAARERFEGALLEGRSAGLVEQDRANLFTQEIGNIPAGAEVVADLLIDQPLRWRQDGAWEWRFPTVVAPRYLGGEGRVADASRLGVDVAEGLLPVDMRLALVIRDALADGGRPASPSHPIRLAGGPSGMEVALADEPGAGLDRDVVIHWPVAQPRVGLSLDTGRPPAGHVRGGAAYGVLTVVPPAPDGGSTPFPRDLIVLLDTSGSMAGAPLEQARRVVGALIESLGEADQLELIAFANEPHWWRPRASRATATAWAEALRWLAQLEAAGGTEMGRAVDEALRPLRPGAQRQVVLVTDGHVGFETEIVAAIARGLPAASRLHTVGVGSAVNRALTAPAARAGRGAEVVIGLDDDPATAAEQLVARTYAPLLVEVGLSGSALLSWAPEGLPDVFAGAPLRVAVRLRPDGGDLHVRGKTVHGAWEASVTVAPVEAGAGSAAVVALFAREAVEDIEMRRAAGEDRAVDAEIERLGLDFHIATRLTAWVAVSDEPTVDPTAPGRRERIPQALPFGLSAEGLGLRGAGVDAASFACCPSPGPPLAEPRSSLEDISAPLTPTRWAFRMLEEAVGRPEVPAPPVAIARVMLRKCREVALEIIAGEVLTWDPDKVELVWEDGTRLAAEIDRRRSTSRGQVAAGQAIRLVLSLPEVGPPAPPARLELLNGGRRLGVDVCP